MKADQIQLALPPEMILLIRISSGAGNTQHLLASASASASWVTVRRGEQTVPGRLFVPFLILCSTCYVRHLDCAEFHLTASRTAPWENQHVTQASSRDTLIINLPLITYLLIIMSFCFHCCFCWTEDEKKYELQTETHMYFQPCTQDFGEPVFSKSTTLFSRETSQQV